LIVENSLFPEKATKNRKGFPSRAQAMSQQMPDGQNILAVMVKNASLYYSQLFYKTPIWGNSK